MFFFVVVVSVFCRTRGFVLFALGGRDGEVGLIEGRTEEITTEMKSAATLFVDKIVLIQHFLVLYNNSGV